MGPAGGARGLMGRAWAGLSVLITDWFNFKLNSLYLSKVNTRLDNLEKKTNALNFRPLCRNGMKA